jgi:cytochrome c biogenesis protein CcdA
MAKKTVTLDNVALGVIAIIAGALVIFWWEWARYILGIFLIVWGILSLLNKA